jgi:hypothetical protein
MKALTLIIAASFLMLCAAVSRADVTADLKRTTVDINTQAQTNDGRTHVLTAISSETGVPVATLQTEQSTTKLGFGELLIANLLASASGKTFDQIVAMFKAGEGWGKIAKDLGLNLRKIVSKARQADQAALQGQNAQGNFRSQAGAANGMGFGPTNNPDQGSLHSMGHGRGP